MNWLIHIANVIFLLSYWVKEMWQLRILTVVGTGILIPYFLSRHDPLWEAAIWTLGFMLINIYQISQIWKKNEKDQQRQS